jgi:hypothetical protein
MSVHKIKLFYPSTGSDQFHQWLQNWHESIGTETTDLINNQRPDSTFSQLGADTTEYYTVTFTYPSYEGRSEILEKPYQKLVECCEWSKVGYHECGDVPDNPDKSDCHYPEHKIHREGEIPNDIPSLN